MSGDILVFTTGAREVLLCGIWCIEAREVTRHDSAQDRPPPQRILQLEMSAMLKCRNPESRDAEKRSVNLGLWNVLGIVPCVVLLC